MLLPLVAWASDPQIASLVDSPDPVAAGGLYPWGHADRLNGTGQSDYNQPFSSRRVVTVRTALAALGMPGIDSASFSTASLGDGQQVQACSGRFASKAELQECLLPNRRVEVRVTAETAPR